MSPATAASLVARGEVVVAVDPDQAFEGWTAGINEWWRLDSPFWMDKERRRGLRFEPHVGGRFIEVYDDAGEGLEIGGSPRGSRVDDSATPGGSPTGPRARSRRSRSRSSPSRAGRW
jgi:hypothetical protein